MQKSSLLFLNYMPSIGWLLFMVFGSVHNLNAYVYDKRALIIIFLVLVLFLTIDTVCFKVTAAASERKLSTLIVGNLVVGNRAIRLMLVLSASIIALRLHLIGFDILKDILLHHDKDIITQARVLRVNNSGINHVMYIVQNIGFSFIFPITAISLLKTRKSKLSIESVSFIFIVIIISVMGGERFPLFAFLTPLLFWISQHNTTKLTQPRTIRISIFCVLLLLFIISLRISSYYKIDSSFLQHRTGQALSPVALDYANMLRGSEYKDIVSIRTTSDFALASPYSIDNVIRRAFLIPSDVSYFYYRLFPTTLQHPFSLGRYYEVNDLSSLTIPNIIGNIIYRAKYPSEYLQQVSAYCSFDADAYARFGLGGVLAASAILMGVRFLSALYWSKKKGNDLFYVCLISSLFWLPSIASIQAMLISYGYIMVLFFLRLAPK